MQVVQVHHHHNFFSTEDSDNHQNQCITCSLCNIMVRMICQLLNKFWFVCLFFLYPGRWSNRVNVMRKKTKLVPYI